MTTTKIKLTAEQIEANTQLVVTLRKQGLSRDKIVAQTGLKERFVREAMKLVEAVEIVKAPTSNLDKAVAKVYPLAVRPQGIKDYELRQALYEVYGTRWDDARGQASVAYDTSTMSRVKTRCKELAAGTDQTALFVMDWVCDEAPTDSRLFLENAGSLLADKIDDLVNSFMESFATGRSDDALEGTEAQRKQQYAARRHILKLAIQEYSQESTAVLLARSLSLTDALEETSDAPVATQAVKTPKAVVEAPVTTDNVEDTLDAFFDAVVVAEASFNRANNTVSADVATTDIDFDTPVAIQFVPQSQDDFSEDDLFEDVLDYTPHITAQTTGGFHAVSARFEIDATE